MRDEKYLTLGDVVAMLNLPPHVIELLCRRGEFPQPLRFGRRYYRWCRSEVDSFLSSAPRGIVSQED